jgi:uncharacterized BrkB/YihY/UPF0761 family membrane protein
LTATARRNKVSRTGYLWAFWDRAYRENVTGLAGMVAYNLLFALFPFALLILFIVGQVLASPDAQSNILLDLQRLFPAAEGSSRSAGRSGCSSSRCCSSPPRSPFPRSREC